MKSLPATFRGRAAAALAAAGLLVGGGLTACTQDSGTESSSPSPTAESGSASQLADECELPEPSATPSPESGDFSAADPDKSALEVGSGQQRAVGASTISKSGDSSSTDSSSFSGLNAAVLISGGGSLAMNGTTVETAGSGANGVFATGTGSSASLQDVSVKTQGSFSHALDVTDGGSLTAVSPQLSTASDHSSVIATDRGGGDIQVSGGNATASGDLSAVIYSTGIISVCGLTGSSALAEAAVVEGANSVRTTSSDLTGGTHGAYLYSSTPGSTGGGTFTMSGGTLTAKDGNAVFVDGVSATINLSNAPKLDPGSGALISVSSNGSASASLQETVLEGQLTADAGSTLSVSLTANSRVTGTLSNVGLELDNTSMVELAADSSATSVQGALVTGNEITNITGNGHTLTYDPGADGNGYLNGQDYQLAGGGTLQAS
ncbi:hypothetical protein FYJ28_10130 [Arthrobacter sp. BL-252-APC-1A]|uniref:hypothetical protein n=1 Tax=Arthrobacter sp. BL-252-APC-1A TaxID=2606622 RepID=UPI0012B18B3E|nr:hypothetical protein [Arthrobacter sp. BL-252-APC-1A]MSR99178.1 hypothetical protein [Arthrobacter sp. BL-252-APC-1A]